MPKTVVTINHPDSVADMKELLRVPQGENRPTVAAMGAYLSAVASGSKTAEVTVEVGVGEVQSSPPAAGVAESPAATSSSEDLT